MILVFPGKKNKNKNEKGAVHAYLVKNTNFVPFIARVGSYEKAIRAWPSWWLQECQVQNKETEGVAVMSENNSKNK